MERRRKDQIRWWQGMEGHMKVRAFDLYLDCFHNLQTMAENPMNLFLIHHQ